MAVKIAVKIAQDRCCLAERPNVLDKNMSVRPIKFDVRAFDHDEHR